MAAETVFAIIIILLIGTIIAGGAYYYFFSSAGTVIKPPITTEEQQELNNNVTTNTSPTRTESWILKGNRGFYCSDNDTSILCDKLTGQKFTAEFQPGGSIDNEFVTLKSTKTGKYCTDAPNGIICNASEPGGWEIYRYSDDGPNTISLRGGRNNKYCTDNPTGITCNTDALDDRGKFTRFIDSAPDIVETQPTATTGGTLTTPATTGGTVTTPTTPPAPIPTVDSGPIPAPPPAATPPIAPPATAPPPPPPETWILKSNKGYYCSDIANSISCKSPHASGWEKFKFEKQLDNTYAFTGGQTKKYCNDQVAGMICQKDPPIAGWEKHTIEDLGNNQVAIKGGRSKKYCVDNGTSIVCNQDTITPDARFTKFLDSAPDIPATAVSANPPTAPPPAPTPVTWILKSNKGLYCSDNTTSIICDKITATAKEKFKFEKQPDNTYAFKSGQSNKYCNDQETGIKCQKDPPIAGWEKYTYEDLGNNKIALKGGRSKKYCVDKGNSIVCDQDTRVPDATFTRFVDTAPDIPPHQITANSRYRLQQDTANQCVYIDMTTGAPKSGTCSNIGLRPFYPFILQPSVNNPNVYLFKNEMTGKCLYSNSGQPNAATAPLLSDMCIAAPAALFTLSPIDPMRTKYKVTDYTGKCLYNNAVNQMALGNCTSDPFLQAYTINEV
jgi:hypothetical protein